MTGGPRHRWRLVTGRPRTSTIVLIGLFLAVFALWIVVRPATATTTPTTPTGNVQSTKGSPAGGSPAPTTTSTLAPSHSPSSSPSLTQTPSSTPTATPDSGSPAP